MTPEDIDAYTKGGRRALRDVAAADWPAFDAGNAPPPSRRAAVLGLIESTRMKLASLSRNLARRAWKGLGGIRDWAADFLLALGSGHFAAAMAATGTVRLTPADLDVVAEAVDEQRGYFRGFRKAISTGVLALWLAVVPDRGKVRAANPRFVWRTELYADPLWGTAERGVRERTRRDGFDQERRLLGVARHCDDCPPLAARGWQPAGTLPGIGQTECGPRCRCSWEYRHTATGLVVPSPLARRAA